MSTPDQSRRPVPKPAAAPPVSETYPVYGEVAVPGEAGARAAQSAPAQRFATYNAAAEHSGRARVALFAGIVAFFVVMFVIVAVVVAIGANGY